MGQAEVKSEIENIELVKFDSSLKVSWDNFISKAKNGSFLFKRDYMEYHADRFTDYSLLFFYKNKLTACLPASLKNESLISHSGLTYGGIISDQNMRTDIMLEIFSSLLTHLENNKISKIIYKAIPHIYHTLPAEEDLYALTLHGAKLTKRDLSSTIEINNKISYTKGRRLCVKQSHNYDLLISESKKYSEFMNIVAENLKNKFGLSPTHSAEEMELLASRFPENIKLYTAEINGAICAGIIVYENFPLAHAQYISSTKLGQELKAPDRLLDFIINEAYADWKYFDFGISTEKDGSLNKNLLFNKESYGARAICYDTYELEIGKQ